MESTSFDFLEQLPLFVVMTMIFQRMSPRMWGLGQRDASQVELDGKAFKLGTQPPRFQLHGRRSYGVPACLIPDEPALDTTPGTTDVQMQDALISPELDAAADVQTEVPPIETGGPRRSARLRDKLASAAVAVAPPPTEQPRPQTQDAESSVDPYDDHPYFFKSSWTEDSRVKEPTIINKAHERAKERLPDGYSQMVTNHLPKIVASEIRTSTARFRLAVKKAGGFKERDVDEIKSKGRVQVVMVTRRLKKITDLEPSDFWKVFWDINRCM